MKVKLDVDHAGGTTVFESDESCGFREASRFLVEVSFANLADEVTVPGSAKPLRVDRIDQVDLTWEP